MKRVGGRLYGYSPI